MQKKLYGVNIAISWTLLLFILQLPEASQDIHYSYLVISLSICCISYVMFYGFSGTGILELTNKKTTTIEMRILNYIDYSISVILYLSFFLLIMKRTDTLTIFELITPFAITCASLMYLMNRIVKQVINAQVTELEDICKDSEASDPQLIARIKNIADSLGATSLVIDKFINNGKDDQK